jgi:hypothetical protein
MCTAGGIQYFYDRWSDLSEREGADILRIECEQPHLLRGLEVQQTYRLTSPRSVLLCNHENGNRRILLTVPPVQLGGAGPGVTGWTQIRSNTRPLAIKAQIVWPISFASSAIATFLGRRDKTSANHGSS